MNKAHKEKVTSLVTKAFTELSSDNVVLYTVKSGPATTVNDITLPDGTVLTPVSKHGGSLGYLSTALSILED